MTIINFELMLTESWQTQVKDVMDAMEINGSNKGSPLKNPVLFHAGDMTSTLQNG